MSIKSKNTKAWYPCSVNTASLFRLAPLWFIKKRQVASAWLILPLLLLSSSSHCSSWISSSPLSSIHPPIPAAFLSWPRHFLFLSFFFSLSHTSDIWPLRVPFWLVGAIITQPFWESPIKDWQGKWMKEALSWVKINWSGQWDRASPSFASIHEQSHRSPLDVSLPRVKWLLYSQ